MSKSILSRILEKDSFFESVDSAEDLVHRCEDYLNLKISVATAKGLLPTLKTVFEFVNNNNQIQEKNTVIDQLKNELQQSKNKIETLEHQLIASNQTIELLQQDLMNANNELSVLQQDLTTANNKISTLQQNLTNSTNELSVLQQSTNHEVKTVVTTDKNTLQQTECNIGGNMELSLEQRSEVEALIQKALEQHKNLDHMPTAKCTDKKEKPTHPLNGAQLNGWTVSWQGRGWSVAKRYGSKVVTRFVGREWNQQKAQDKINEYLNTNSSMF